MVYRSNENIPSITLNEKKDEKQNRSDPVESKERRKWKPYLLVSLLVTSLTIILRVVGLSFDLVNIALLYLFPVLVSAACWGIGPSFYAAGIGVLAFDFFFVPPVYSFTVSDLRYLISFAVFLSVATLTASLASRLRQQVVNVRQREAITNSLYALSRQLTAVADMESVLGCIVRQVQETAGIDAAIFLPDGKGGLSPITYSDSDSNWGHSDTDITKATWVYRHGQMAGRGTRILSESNDLYVPMRTQDQIHGVLAVHFGTPPFPATFERLQLMEALAGLAALAIARIKLQEEAKIAHLTAESERLRTALLDSISHELRTPLATIIGAVTGLMDEDSRFSEQDRFDLLSTIREGSMRMNRLVTNLLGMVRLESGMLKLNKHWCDLEDIVGVALNQVKDALQNREVKVILDESVPLIEADDVLIEQVLVNVLSNAIKYSPDNSEIVITARRNRDSVELAVKDQGIGISLQECERIFDKFYRTRSTQHIPGTGLGLAICKGIVEAHGGIITASPNCSRGTIITILLPLSNPLVIQNEEHEKKGGSQ